jgi:hypothetical protein
MLVEGQRGLQAVFEPLDVKQCCHEAGLVDPRVEAVADPVHQRALGQVAAAVQRSPAVFVGSLQQGAVILLRSREPPQRRPQAIGQPHPMQDQVRVQAGHAPVAVEERVDPRQPVVRRRGRDDGHLAPARATVHLGPPPQESQQRRGRRRLVPADRHLA